MRYIVINENSMGVIDPNASLVTMLASFPTRGATFTTYLDPRPIFEYDVVRDATLTDFDIYRLVPPPNIQL